MSWKIEEFHIVTHFNNYCTDKKFYAENNGKKII